MNQETVAVDSGVDSEVSPSSPDSACNNGNSLKASSSKVENKMMEEEEEEEEDIMATAETLLALSGKSTGSRPQQQQQLQQQQNGTKGKKFLQLYLYRWQNPIEKWAKRFFSVSTSLLIAESVKSVPGLFLFHLVYMLS